jgi:outer membrane protein insertion porin family
MKKMLIVFILIILFSLTSSSETIEKIVVEGNKKVSRDTVLFYMKSRENGMYSASLLREDFKSLWKTGFFENITIESDEGIRGKVVKIKVEENLLISTITYKTGKKVKEKDIVEKLQENNIVLTPYSYYNPAKMKKVERVISEMLTDKGFNQGEVKIITKMEKDQIALTINVSPGPKTRIGEIVFPGLKGTGVSASFLRGGMKNNKKSSFFSKFGGKDVYNREKMEEDLEELKVRLQQKGYLEAKVGNPSFSTFVGRTFFGSVREMMRLSIPVELGPRYRLGEVNIEGNKIIKTEYLKRIAKLK